MSLRHTCTTDSVDCPCPKTNCPSSENTLRCTVVFFPKKCQEECWLCFKNINLLAPFPYYYFVSLLLFTSSKWKSCFHVLSGKPNRNGLWNYSFGWVELKKILFFLILEFFIFPPNVLYFWTEGVSLTNFMAFVLLQLQE